MDWKRYVSTLLLIVTLVSCKGQPAVAPPADTPTPIAQPTAETMLTDTPAASTGADISSPTATATPSPAISIAPTGSIELAEALTETITATATAIAATPASAAADAGSNAAGDDLLAAGSWQQLVGNCDQARRIFAELLATAPASATAAEAHYRMAQCYLRDEAYAEAWATLKELLGTVPEVDPHRAPAQFLLGEALAALGNWPAAEAAYTAYLPLAPELGYLTQQRIAAARVAQGNLARAAEAYRAALAASPDKSNTTTIRRALADLALEQGDTTEAITQYDALRGSETKGSLAAEMQYLAGNALARPALLLAQAAQLLAPSTPAATVTPFPIPAEALARWQAAVDADITSRWAHAAIVALLDAGATVDEYQRGRANYHNKVYDLAIAAFDRLRAADDKAEHVPGDTWYYAGLSYLALGNTDRGLAELDHFIANYPNDPLSAAAWLAMGQAQARTGLAETAIATYRRLAELRPDAPQAATALWRAAILLDVEPPTAEAAEAYLILARRYPKADEGWRAYQNAGLIYFRLGDWGQATATWQEMAAQADLPAFTRPVAYFWLGRAQHAAGNSEAAGQAWQAASAASAESFYGLRATVWEQGEQARGVRQVASFDKQLVIPPIDPSKDTAEIAAWLRTWAGDGTLSLDGIAADADWVRGRTLLMLGLRTPALANWERVRTRYAENPWTTAALALAFREAGAHRLSLLSAERVVVKWGHSMRDAPAALQRLAYPIPYTDLIRGEAEKQALDPRLLAAIIRQESRFEGGATSVAGAQGLMQVMPGTAEGIARQLSWPGFEPRQAYWPYVNVAFGAFYVRQWLTHFSGSVFTALAAYNGGPGNAAIWHQWAPDDDDLLAALININETRTYVQAVWANYEAYQQLYPD